MPTEDSFKAYGEMPVAELTVEGKSFRENGEELLLDDLEIELTSGCEASQAVYRIYNCIEGDTGHFRIEALRPYILLGSAVSIKIGYTQAKTEVFRGLIGKTVFLDEEEGACVEVTAMDLKSVMMTSLCQKQLAASGIEEAVREILKEPPYQRLQSMGLLERLVVQAPPGGAQGGDGQRLPFQMTGESHYSFLCRAAKWFGCEFYVTCGTLYFRPARAEKQEAQSIDAKRELLSYRISYDLRGQTEEVEIRAADRGNAEPIIAARRCKNRHSLGNRADKLLSGSKVVLLDGSVLSGEEAGERARSVLTEISYRFGALEALCRGRADLNPGSFIRLTGIGGPADNRFYLTAVRHRLSFAEGYTTQLTGEAAEIGGEG